jgi:ketosteroid isomerase-like protein
MSANVDLVRASFEIYERGDLDAIAEMMHPDFELHDWPEAADPRVYHGMEGIVEATKEWSEAWEYMRAEPIDFVDAGDRVLVLLRNIGKGRGSSIEMTQETFGVYTIRDGKVSKIQYFTDREAALAAAGLTADEQRQEAT